MAVTRVWKSDGFFVHGVGQWRTLVSTLMNLPVPQNAFTSGGSITISKLACLLELVVTYSERRLLLLRRKDMPHQAVDCEL
jgi:hypothetical protein